MIGWGWTAAVVAALLAAPLIGMRPAAGADVDVVLIARANDWHVGSPSATTKPTITVNPGDVLRLQVHNHDGTDHTFSFPRFGIDRQLAPGSDAVPTVIFVNLTTSPADAGRWQFYCAVDGHAPGANESRVGMVGWVLVGSPPPTPALDALLVVAALGFVGIAVRTHHRRRK